MASVHIGCRSVYLEAGALPGRGSGPAVAAKKKKPGGEHVSKLPQLLRQLET
jgi:hypothetical protein